MKMRADQHAPAGQELAQRAVARALARHRVIDDIGRLHSQPVEDALRLFLMREVADGVRFPVEGLRPVELLLGVDHDLEQRLHIGVHRRRPQHFAVEAESPRFPHGRGIGRGFAQNRQEGGVVHRVSPAAISRPRASSTRVKNSIWPVVVASQEKVSA
jgi:hypothetical protein